MENKNIIRLAGEFVLSDIKKKDALHLACAVESECRFFITVDNRLLNKRVKNIKIVNPFDFVKSVENNETGYYH
ncbi:hypothetical protein FACS1894214_2760 [Planctomycetales bacterium]|nr:hypothetical protein FACS1894214_2760 [Planctomycetales bacterium]